MASERRRMPRYPAQGLRLTVREQDPLSGLLPPTAPWVIDFNRYGLAFKDASFRKVGTSITLDLFTDHVWLDHLGAVIYHRLELEHNYRFGVQFEWEASDFRSSGELRQILIAIEEHVIGGVVGRSA